jgi:hypothetical protein
MKQQENKNFVTNHCETKGKQNFVPTKQKIGKNYVSNHFARQKRIDNMLQIIAKQKGNKRALL